MQKQKIRVAFIGCGRVSENHFKAVESCEYAELAAISDVDAGLAARRAKEWDTTVISAEEICGSGQIDAVFVLTPCEMHFKYVQMALEGGKHVLVEKPVSFDYHEIEKMRDIARKTGKICMPGHSYIYLPEMQRMLKHIKQNKIGVPTSMFMSEIYYMPGELISKYHGPINEIMCHQIYLMLAYMGIPESVQAFSGCFRKSDLKTNDEQVTVNALFGNGALAHLFASWAGEDNTSDPWTFKVKILGLEGGLHFSRRDFVRSLSDGGKFFDYPMYDEMFEREVDYFIRDCIFQGRQPVSTIDDAITAIKILDCIKTSIANRSVEAV